MGDFQFYYINPTLQNALEYINCSIISGQKCYCLKDIFQILRALSTYIILLYVQFSDIYVNQSLAGQTIDPYFK
jgi:hypothetical protein